MCASSRGALARRAFLPPRGAQPPARDRRAARRSRQRDRKRRICGAHGRTTGRVQSPHVPPRRRWPRRRTLLAAGIGGVALCCGGSYLGWLWLTGWDGDPFGQATEIGADKLAAVAKEVHLQLPAGSALLAGYYFYWQEWVASLRLQLPRAGLAELVSRSASPQPAPGLRPSPGHAPRTIRPAGMTTVGIPIDQCRSPGSTATKSTPGKVITGGASSTASAVGVSRCARTFNSFAGQAQSFRPTPQRPSTSAGRPAELGSGRHRGWETTPGSSSSRPSKKRAICSGLRR